MYDKTVYILIVNGNIVDVYAEYINAYDKGCKKYNGEFEIEEFEVK